MARLDAIEKLHTKSFPIGIHFDPIIFDHNLLEEYRELIEDLNKSIPLTKVRYISLGVVRFTKDVYHQVQKNYPNGGGGNRPIPV
jgi:spore photoproduct lyase